jgi:hypothetical protein
LREEALDGRQPGFLKETGVLPSGEKGRDSRSCLFKKTETWTHAQAVVDGGMGRFEAPNAKAHSKTG